MPSSNGMPSGWREASISSICDIRRGASPRPIDDPQWFAAQGPGWVRIIDVTRSRRYLRETEQSLSELGASKSVRVRPGDVIMSICATIGCAVIVDMDACIHDGFVLFDNLSQEVDREYLCHLLERQSTQFSSQGQKGTQGNLNTSIVKRTLLLLPPRTEQQRIVEILASVDDAIEQTRAVIGQTRNLKTALLHDLLTNGLPGRHKSFKTVRRLGRVPKSWEVVSMDSLTTLVTSGSRGWSAHVAQHGSFFVRSQNLGLGVIRWDDVVYVNPPQDQEADRARIRPYDILVSVTGEPGNVAVATDDLGDAYVSQHVALVRLTDESMAPWLGVALSSPCGQLQFRANLYGQTRPGLNLDNISELLVPIPEKHERVACTELINAVQRRIHAATSQVTHLVQVKAALSQALLTGRVRVQAKGGK